MKDKIIIAEKSKFMLWVSLGLIAVISAIFLPIIIRDFNSPWGGIGVIFFLIPLYSCMVLFPLILLIIWLSHPKNLVSLSENSLTFYPSQQEITVTSIIKIENYGSTLLFILDNTKIKVWYVKNTESVVSNINNLIIKNHTHKEKS